MTLAGVFITTAFGPHVNDAYDTATLSAAFWKFAFHLYAFCACGLLTAGWVLLTPDKPPWYRILLSAYTAALCGATSMLLLKVRVATEELPHTRRTQNGPQGHEHDRTERRLRRAVIMPPAVVACAPSRDATSRSPPRRPSGHPVIRSSGHPVIRSSGQSGHRVIGLGRSR